MFVRRYVQVWADFKGRDSSIIRFFDLSNLGLFEFVKYQIIKNLTIKKTIMQRYNDLEILKLSVKFCVPIYRVTAKFPSEEKFNLVSQLRKASVSVPSNIAEGSAKSSDKHF